MSPFDLPIAVYVVEEPAEKGLEARVVDCNDQFRRIFGIPLEEPLPFLSSRFYRDPRTREDLRQELDRAKQRGEDLKIVIPLQGRNRNIWALDFTRALSDPGDKQIGALCCLIDVTQEENIRRLLDELPVGIYHLDAEDRLVECNRQFSEMTGYSINEALGRTVVDFYTDPEEAEEFHRLVRQQGTVIDHPLQVTKKTGETILTSVSSALIGGGEPYQGRVGALTDISKVERYRQIIDYLPIGLFKIQRSRQGIEVIEHCNDPFAEIFGLEPSQLIGQPVQRLHASEATYNAILKTLSESDQRGEALGNYEIEARNNEGDRRILQINTRQLKNRKGEIVGRVGAAQDVTRQRKLQEKVSKLQSLSGAVLHAYIHTLTTLAQTLDPVGEFLGPDPYQKPNGIGGADQIIGRGDIAKVLAELRPRAGRLTGALDRVLAAREEPGREGAWDHETWERLRMLRLALERPLKSSNPEVAHAYFREIAQGILSSCNIAKPGHLSRELVRQLEQDARELGRVACLLSLASVKNAVVEMDSQVRALRENLTLEQREEIKEDIGVLELVHSSVASQAEFFYLRDIELHNRLSEVGDVSKWVVRGSRRDLVRALGNLLHNAIKYSWSRAGEGSRPWIELYGTFINGTVSISIENWGVPIPKDEESLVFEFGYRGRFSADRNRAGTGVGLHDSREVALGHRGDVKIHSRPTYSGDPEDYSRPFLTTATLILPIFRKEN